MSTIVVGNSTWLTATPDFATGVNSRQHAELKNAGLFTDQVNANCETLLTRRNYKSGLMLATKNHANRTNSPLT
jgi:hypothetical protein